MVNSFRQTVATPRKWPGRRVRPRPPVSPGVDPGREAGRIHLVDASARTRRRRLRPRRARGRAPRRADTRRGRRLVELRRVDEQRHDDDVPFSGARRAEERDVAVVERAHRRDEPTVVRAARLQLGDRADDLHGDRQPSRRRASRRAARARDARRGSPARCASTVAQSPRAIGPVSSKPFSIVRRISGTSASAGAPAASSSSAAARCSVTR